MQISPLILGCAGTTLTPQERDFFTENPPFGFILFTRNIENLAQLRALIDQLCACTLHDGPIFIDQEGGRVARMQGQGWMTVPPPLDHAAHPKFERLFYLRARLIGEDLSQCGITANCAPVLDIAQAKTHPILKNRCYGMTPDQVIRAAKAVIQGHNDAGIYSVIKHIPGQGRADLDSHVDLPRVAASLCDLERLDFRPFMACRDVPFGMSAHVVYEALDKQHPATQSRGVIDKIRRDIGFENILMSDDIAMNALSGDVVTRALKALKAGCDIVLHCNGEMAQMRPLAHSLGPLKGKSLERAQAALAAKPARQYVDIAALKEEFSALLVGR